MNDALRTVLDCLALEAIDDDGFRGPCESRRHGRIFGGQVLGQALMAASLTVDNRPAHSIQALFLRRGDPSHTVDFEVERTRDGRSFSARRVLCKQGDRVLLSFQASFQKPEARGYEHEDTMPEAPDPDSLPSSGELAKQMIERLPERSALWAGEQRAIEVRHTSVPSYLGGPPTRDANFAWMRVESELPDDPRLHQCLLAYASDLALNDSAIRPHAGPDSPPLAAMSSLDHAMWFHEATRMDEWLLFVQRSPKAAGGRGYAAGEMYSRDGRRVASLGQDSMMRPARASTDSAE